jgi:Mrp family chromosome partitioning ATPase
VLAFANRRAASRRTSTLNLAVALAEQGLSVLAVDLDSPGT